MKTQVSWCVTRCNCLLCSSQRLEGTTILRSMRNYASKTQQHISEDFDIPQHMHINFFFLFKYLACSFTVDSTNIIACHPYKILSKK